MWPRYLFFICISLDQQKWEVGQQMTRFCRIWFCPDWLNTMCIMYFYHNKSGFLGIFEAHVCAALQCFYFLMYISFIHSRSEFSVMIFRRIVLWSVPSVLWAARPWCKWTKSHSNWRASVWMWWAALRTTRTHMIWELLVSPDDRRILLENNLLF